MAGTRSSATEFRVLLRQHRVAAGLTQEELAELSGLSTGAIANMERGRSARPYRTSVTRLADALGLTGRAREAIVQAARGALTSTIPVSDNNQSEPHTQVPRQLPAVVRHFTGRADELETLTAILHQPASADASVVISAIAGTAGVGKTALAVQWAHRVADRFPDGQLYANLRGYDPGQPITATDALARFLRDLGVPGPDIPAEEDGRAALYRSLLAGRRMVIVLDNASEVEQVRPLLPGTPECVAVVTSRNALAGLVARDGARRVDLDLLPLADAVSLLQALIGSRVNDDPEAAAALAVHCCRLPLALRVAAELAVARPATSLAELAHELADKQRRLDLLDADGDPRTAVRAVFSWSIWHLDPGAARAFRVLGLHPGPDLDVYAAAALTGTSLQHASQLVDRLARAQLIQTARPGRYSMHDLLRDYACERAAADDGEGEERAALTRLFGYYLHTAATAMDTLYPAEKHRRPQISPSATLAPPLADPAAALTWLDTERGCLIVVAAHAADHGWPGHATQLAATLFRYLEVGGHYPEAIAIHDCARRAAHDTGDTAAEAAALNALGISYLPQGRLSEATSHLEQALSLWQQTGDRSGEARTLGNLGNVEWRQGRYRQAASHHRRALTLFRETGDRVAEAHALSNLGIVDERQGRYRQAASHHRRALALYRESGDRTGEARTLHNLGEVELHQGSYQTAISHLEQALTAYRQTGDRVAEAHALASIGEAELHQGSYQEATSHLERALALSRESGDRDVEAEVLNDLAAISLATGDPSHAQTQHAAALALASQTDDAYQQARAHHGLGSVCHASGDSGQARHHWQLALTLYTELGAPEAAQVRTQLASSDSSLRPELAAPG